MARAYAAFAVALCVAAVVVIVVLLSKESGDFAEDLAITAVALLINGLAISAGIALLGRSDLAWLGLLCAVVGVVAFGVGASLGWSSGDQDPGEGLLKASGSLTAFSLALAQTAILLARRTTADRNFAEASIGIAVVGALALAALLTVAIIDEVSDEDFYRWVGVTAVIWVLGVALVPVARGLQRRPERRG